MAYQIDLDSRCRSCGHLLSECTDEGTEGRWQPHVESCQVTKARADFYAKHQAELGPEHIVYFTLVDDEDDVTDPLAYDPERARREHEAMQARHFT